MLFSYKIFTFSQLPNKFYNRKILNIHLTQPKIKIKTSFIHKLGERRKKEWEIEGKRDRLVWEMGLRNGFVGVVGSLEWVWGMGFLGFRDGCGGMQPNRVE